MYNVIQMLKTGCKKVSFSTVEYSFLHCVVPTYFGYILKPINYTLVCKEITILFP